MKLVSLNIERDRHLADQRRFFDRVGADVVCLQEVHEGDFERLRENFGHGVFAPMVLTRTLAGRFDVQGVCMLSPHALEDAWSARYRDVEGPLVEFQMGVTSQLMINRLILTAKVRIGGVPVSIVTTHFTWSPDGVANAEQRRDVELMLEMLAPLEPLVLTGDFNAPRGGEIFARIAERYRDCIPAHHHTSIDGARHRMGHLEVMVDGLFTSAGVSARDVRLVDGVSDHMAVVADIAVE